MPRVEQLKPPPTPPPNTPILTLNVRPPIKDGLNSEFVAQLSRPLLVRLANLSVLSVSS